METELLSKYGPWALITGASSGIGEAFSRRLASLKFNLILVARREERLQKLADELSVAHSIDVRVCAADLATDNFFQSVVDVAKDVEVGLLINNAGFALTGRFHQHSLEDELSLLHVNCRAPLMLSHHFGNLMLGYGRGGIINISSASALMPIPFWTNYSAAKVYLLHFSEALWFEMKKNGVDVLAVCPGSTATEFSARAGTSMNGMPVTKVVDSALASLGKKPSVIVGAIYRISDFVLRFISRRAAIILGSGATGAS